MQLDRRRPSLPSELGSTLGGWLTGQLKIVAILMAIYSVGFAVSGVPWWLLVGVVCGALNIVPVLGAVIAMGIALGTAWLGSDDIWPVIGALITFVVAQALEGFYLTPKILGTRLRLKPWVVFLAILIGGFAFGPLGIIFAAPALAILAVLWRRYSRA
jgi:predicted PurR-regulated permease PerM